MDTYKIFKLEVLSSLSENITKINELKVKNSHKNMYKEVIFNEQCIFRTTSIS